MNIHSDPPGAAITYTRESFPETAEVCASEWIPECVTRDDHVIEFLAQVCFELSL